MPRPAWHLPIDARARRWVETALGDGARVVGTRRLAGGIATAADAVWAVVRGEPEPRETVLRRWMRPGWQVEDPALTPGHEAAILAALDGSGLPVPRVVAVDPDGTACGVPGGRWSRSPARNVRDSPAIVQSDEPLRT